jgi:ribosomal protein S18 acetylase RimI-like enzyme
MVAANQAGFWTGLEHCPGVEVTHVGAFDVVVTGLSEALFNIALQIPTAGVADSDLQLAMQALENSGRPHTIRVNEGVPEHAVATLLAAGFEEVHGTTGMIVRAGGEPTTTIGQALEFVEVESFDTEHGAMWSSLLMESFGFGAELRDSVGALFLNSDDRSGDRRNFLGMIDGTPVACGSLAAVSGTVGLYNIGTPPELNQRGHGSQMSRFLLERASSYSHQWVTLQATAPGRRIYERLGFVAVTTFRDFVRQ